MKKNNNRDKINKQVGNNKEGRARSKTKGVAKRLRTIARGNDTKRVPTNKLEITKSKKLQQENIKKEQKIVFKKKQKYEEK